MVLWCYILLTKQSQSLAKPDERTRHNFYLWNKASFVFQVYTHAYHFNHHLCSSAKHMLPASFCPLIIWIHFQSKGLILSTSPALPWCKLYPPHVQGIPATDTTPTSWPSSVNGHQPATKIKHPTVECGINPSTGQGFQLKETMKLPDDLYKEMLANSFAQPVHAH